MLRRVWRSSSIKLLKEKTINKNLYATFHVLHQPDVVTERKSVPESVLKPPYAQQESPLRYALQSFIKPFSGSNLKDENTIQRIRESCQIGRSVLNEVGKNVKEGVTTDDLDDIAHSLICETHHAYPSTLGYKGFPKSLCTSVNNVVVHGIPDRRPLMSGDIINVDITVYKNGCHGDLSEMFTCGEVDDTAKNLIQTTKECLLKAIDVCHPGEKFSRIGQVVSAHALSRGFAVCPYFVGHGIGEEFHEAPQVLHHENQSNAIMRPGLVFTIEPVICEGTPEIMVWDDGWTVVTIDNKRAAQFEHTVLITDNGVEVLTKDEP